TLDFLTSPEPRPLRGNGKGLLPLIRDYVKTGLALLSDQSRVEADVVRRHEERVRALQEVRTASAELARLLHLDPGGFLLPVEDFRWPLNLPGEEWADVPLEDLAAFALQNRPELAENRALIDAALARLRTAEWRPLLPNVIVNYNWGGFGGGPDLKPRGPRGIPALGPSGVIADFGSRSD